MSEDNVIPVEFGKQYNDAARQLARLMDFAKEREKALSADPAAFIAEAGERIVVLMRRMRAAKEALLPVSASYFNDGATPTRMETVTVPLDDYRRWKACEEIVRGWSI